MPIQEQDVCFEVSRKRLLVVDEVIRGAVELDAAAVYCGAGERGKEEEEEEGTPPGLSFCATCKIVLVPAINFCIKKL
jgi:hypothetical protein